jgi:hypothetical protein
VEGCPRSRPPHHPVFTLLLTTFIPRRRDEFKRHKKADAKFLVSFFGEWEGYLRTLQTQSVAGGGGGGGAGSGLGRELSGEERAQLTDEQRVQLDKLRKEATGLYKDG